VARRSRPVLIWVLALLSVLCAATALSSCGTDAGGDDASGRAVEAVASFYPLAFVTERVGGDRVAVTDLTPPGVEPHDLELSPRDVASVADADLVVYLAGFSPAVDDAVDGEAVDRSLEVGQFARLDLPSSDSDAARAEGDGHGAADPHFWLDPLRLADVADQVAERLGELEPGSAATFEANAAELRRELEALDSELAAGLADCDARTMVTGHEAFGYLADRYDLTQVGIGGVDPEGEPTPADLAEISRFVDEHGVSTIYHESLVSPAVAEAVAAETGAAIAVLDPLEGLPEDAEAVDYFSAMHANLATLREGQGCR
jgi:zinc transport system substrate-binding protein